jgi:hypothetical protein
MDKKVWVNKAQREDAKRQIALVSLWLTFDMDIAPVQLDLALTYLEMFRKERKLYGQKRI